MGARKRNSSEKIKESRKTQALAKLNSCPTSPRKMRLVADLVRGEDVYKALNILKFSPKHASRNLEKLLLSAINNWEQKHDGEYATSANLVVNSINVDSARKLKRIQAAPQGRAHRIRNRSNPVPLLSDKA